MVQRIEAITASMSLHGPSLTLPLGLACDTPMDVANIRLETIVVYEIKKIVDTPSSPHIPLPWPKGWGYHPGEDKPSNIYKITHIPTYFVCLWVTTSHFSSSP